MKCLLFKTVAILSFAAATVSDISATELATLGAQQALEQTAAENKYAFVVFSKDDGPATQAMIQEVSQGVAQRPDRAAMIRVQVGNSTDKAVVDRFDVGRAPMPLTLAVAPNGAITGAFPRQATSEQLEGVFVTPAMAACMKSMQQGRMVFLCLQTTSQAVVPQGVSDFLADPQFKDRCDVVMLDAADAAEAELVKELDLAAASNSTRAIFFAPPGVLVGRFADTATKAELGAALHKAGKCCDDPNCKHAKGQAAGGSVR